MKDNTNTVALIDGDLICYKACSVVEKEIRWNDDLHTLDSNLTDAIEVAETFIAKVVKDLNPMRKIFCFTPSGLNFRKDIYPLYKAQREVKRKPLALKGLREYLKSTYETIEVQGLEADDIIGVLATTNSSKYQGDKVIVSKDKDFKQIPTKLYIEATDGQRASVIEISEEMADRWFYTQILTGDTSDNYPGCPRIGPKGAEKELAKLDILDKQAVWKRIVELYDKAGFGEDYALQMARCARILRACDFDFKTKQPILWEPGR